MIQVDGLSIAYHGFPLFENAVFSIQEKEHCGFVGRNGSGKSTLFRLLTGKEQSDKGTISIRKNYSVGALDQHIVFTQHTVLDEAALGLRPEDKEMIYKAETILFGLGFTSEDMDRSPKELSGGYHLRLHLAKVLISEPNCLLLDEPTNYLDIVSIRWLEKFLKNWPGEFILISHDREFMDAVTTHTMGIHRNKIKKYKGGTVEFFEKIFQEEEIHERTRVNLEKKRAHAQEFIDRFGAKASKAVQAQSRAKQIARIPVLEQLKGLYNLDFQFNEAPFPGKKMLDAKNLAFTYKPSEDELLINDFSLSLEKGERIAIIGKNGRGKSTLLRLLAKDLTPVSGEVACSENLRLGYFGQTNIDRLNPKHTVYEEVSLGNPKLSYTEVKAICGMMMFSGSKADKTASVLSGGEKSRVLLGKILASPCNFLMLDEPTHHLDMESIEALIDALEDFSGSIVLVTHSELILKRMALDKIVLCSLGGQEIFTGTYEDFLEKKGWAGEEESTKPKKKGVDQKVLKQQKADLINARSRALKPIEKEMQDVEKKITGLEVEREQNQKEWVAQAQKQDGRSVQELSQAIAAKNKELDVLYKKLSDLTEKFDTCSLEYTVKIDALP